MSRGALCISIDLELAWGIWDKPSGEYHRLCAEKEREVVRSLLALFASREVAVTWAIVGHLLDRTDEPPTRTEFGDRIWLAPDLVEAIRTASPAHDVGSHGYAHLYFGGTERERLRADLRAARRVHEEHGLPFTSFVFPRNEVAHLDLLAEAGLAVFRGADVGWHMAARSRLGVTAGRAAHLLDGLLPIPPSVAPPTEHAGGLVEVRGSMLLLGRSGLRRLVRPALAEWKARLGLRRAAARGEVFHLWFHPSNFYLEDEVQLRVLARVLDDACAMRDRGTIDVRTLASFAQLRPTVAVAREERHLAGGMEASSG